MTKVRYRLHGWASGVVFGGVNVNGSMPVLLCERLQLHTLLVAHISVQVLF
jgi:hypothetical protein